MGSTADKIVRAVSRADSHSFSKDPVSFIEVISGFGVKGDAHAGAKIKHRSRVKADPDQPNLRQVHLLSIEMLEELDEKGFSVNPGDLGENITTQGIDLLGLGQDTLLRIGPDAVLSVTGLRNPCHQIDDFRPGLLNQMVERTKNGLIRKAGIMCVALSSGIVRAGDAIRVFHPEGPRIPLERV